jgi:hypothetical protein
LVISDGNELNLGSWWNLDSIVGCAIHRADSEGDRSTRLPFHTP